jgi:hypothetical protein
LSGTLLFFIIVIKLLLAVWLDIPKSTLSSWLKNIDLDSKSKEKINKHIKSTKIVKLIKRNKDRSKKTQENHKKNRLKSENEAKKFSNDPLFLTGLALYWGEGYKKGAEGSKWKSIDFANSDPEMIKLMIKFFFKFLPIQKSDIKVQLMSHNTNDDAKNIAFWKKTTGLNDNNFLRVSHVISKSSQSKVKNKLKHGTIHLRINKVILFFRLIGWIDFLKKKFKDIKV